MERRRGDETGRVYTSLPTRPPHRLDGSDSCYCNSSAAECDEGEDTLFTPGRERHGICLPVKWFLFFSSNSFV